MENKKLSKNFWLSELGYIEPEKDLLNILQTLRDHLGVRVTVTSSARTMAKHIKIYQGRYKEKWLDYIPWESYHLPKFGKNLMAADIAVAGYTGEMLKYKLLEVKNIPLGIIVGSDFLHIDVRDKDYEGRYGY